MPNPLHIPGEAHIPLPIDARLYWGRVGIGKVERAMPLTEEECILIKRASIRVTLDPSPFPPGSIYSSYGTEKWGQTIGDLHRHLSLPVPLNAAETRYWRACFRQRSHSMGFGGQLNFYVFNAFDRLPQMFIRAAMRSPEPPPLPKAAPALRYKSTYGEYPVATTLENRIQQEVPRLIQEEEFQGALLKRGADALVREILFYVAGKESAAAQYQRCQVAYVQCRAGKWDIPLGMEHGK